MIPTRLEAYENEIIMTQRIKTQKRLNILTVIHLERNGRKRVYHNLFLILGNQYHCSRAHIVSNTPVQVDSDQC
jgi:hypothetical protein